MMIFAEAEPSTTASRLIFEFILNFLEENKIHSLLYNDEYSGSCLKTSTLS